MAEYSSHGKYVCLPFAVHVTHVTFFFVQLTGNRYVPKASNFNAMVGQRISITLTQKAEGTCQHMSVTPVEDGLCTIQLVSTRYDFMEFSSQRVCTLLVSSETVSSTAQSTVAGMALKLDKFSDCVVANIISLSPISVSSRLDISSSVVTMMPGGGEPQLSSTDAIAIAVVFPTGLILVCCVTLGCLFLIIHIFSWRWGTSDCPFWFVILHAYIIIMQVLLIANTALIICIYLHGLFHDY